MKRFVKMFYSARLLNFKISSRQPRKIIVELSRLPAANTTKPLLATRFNEQSIRSNFQNKKKGKKDKHDSS